LDLIEYLLGYFTGIYIITDYYSGCIDLISLFGLPMAIDFLCSLFLSSLFFLDHEPLLTLSIQTEPLLTSELLEQAFIGFSYKHFLSSSSYYFDLGSTL
jgi:hypothetical protein